MCNKSKEFIKKLRKMSIGQRQELVEQIYVRFPEIEELLTKIRHCMEYSKFSAEPECMVIKGDLGSGKTTLIKCFARDYPNRRIDGGMIVPVLVVSIPVPASVKSLVTESLKAFGDAAYSKGTTTVQTIRLREYVKECETQLLIFDEFQHFIDRDSLNVLRTLSDWLKNLIDKSDIPIIVVGMPSCDAVLDEKENEQLKRRFSTREILKPFGWRTKEQRRDFRTFLNMLDEMLPLTECSHLADFKTAFLIHQATGGTIAYVMKLIRRATALALEYEMEKIDIELLSQSYEERLGADRTALKNPFEPSGKNTKRRSANEVSSMRRTTNRRVKGRKKEETAADVLKQH